MAPRGAARLMDWLLLVLGAGVGGIGGWLSGRRYSRRFLTAPAGRPKPVQLVASEPPELAWITRANGARGIWLRRSGRGHGSEYVPDPRIEPGLRDAILARLSANGGRLGRTDVERIEEGVLAFVAADDFQAAILLPDRQPAAQAQRDLELLIGLIRTRETLEEAASPPSSGDETVRGLALRLALDVERALQAEVAVAVRRNRGAQVIATSPRADPHYHRILAVPGSAVDLAVQGQVTDIAMAYDPFGVLPSDRRLRERRAFVLRIGDREGEAFAALVIWPQGGVEPVGPARAEVDRQLHRVGPRLGDALIRDELADRAIRDPLTGLHNRAGLQAALGRVEPRSGALIVVDLDHFKSLNDTMGHPAGDAALEAVAAILEDAVRGGADTAARVGGEEFAVWLPDTGLARARTVAERLRASVEELGWSWQGREWPLTASVGVASWPETTRSRENLFAQADAALYRAKAGGRNRVDVAPTE
jgi:diguanylate cyclase (GGDEF)-like protein